MANEDRYKVVIGMSVTKADGTEFSDFGIVYSNMHYDQMVQVEGAFAAHADEINEGIKGLVADLVGMGVEEAKTRGNPVK